jgi:hypothetical protein
MIRSRLVAAGVSAAAAAALAVPLFVGLADGASAAPRPPAGQAQHRDDHGRHHEPGDDHGRKHHEPGDDHGRKHHEPGEDHGRHRHHDHGTDG